IKLPAPPGKGQDGMAESRESQGSGPVLRYRPIAIGGLSTTKTPRHKGFQYVLGAFVSWW
ncbi:MAG: hypothetical protein OES41_16950, partial [Rhodospirillales bacterium]|nr:hypothetical protein [Rhodospirillales bacterium]